MLSSMTTARREPPASREQANRLTLIDRWRHFVLDQPVLVDTGETIWIEDGHLLVQRVDGRLDSYPGSMNRCGCRDRRDG
ncbi:hypothetical protein [Micromonospora sp. 4G55]|uniref:hypothetical protein n=1 Tax=Micromonospora sp. 4G55 TaxID=2806102 RepID=UPI001A639160|nr:hypothetical protein [Micromonospora sp. 4G55]MBM0255652.1 hypothetical protein [Micromonospora sp. 4G55]